MLPDAPLPSGSVAGEHTFSSSQTKSSQQNAQSAQPDAEQEREQAEEQVRRQEKQRIMGVVPNFNIAYNADAPPLTPGQKLRVAFRSAVDPFAFVAAALDAGISQAEDEYSDYGQGAQGYAKRFGASYVDNFDGTILGNAVFPILLKEDPRYFRRGTGTIKRRILYSMSTTVWCKRDSGGWGPNYANVMGNLAAGGISNLYYPASDRGAGLTFERAFTVTAEGMIGALANEFLPDLTRHFLHRDVSGKKTDKP